MAGPDEQPEGDANRPEQEDEDAIRPTPQSSAVHVTGNHRRCDDPARQDENAYCDPAQRASPLIEEDFHTAPELPCWRPHVRPAVNAGALDRGILERWTGKRSDGLPSAPLVGIQGHRSYSSSHSGLAQRMAERRGGNAADVEAALAMLRQKMQGFDPDKGYRFSSWSTWWIQLSLSRGRQWRDSGSEAIVRARSADRSVG